MTKDLKAIGRRVNGLRRDEGLTQDELGKAIGKGRGVIAGIETGNDQGGIDTMEALADHYQVSVDWLLGREGLGLPPVRKIVDVPRLSDADVERIADAVIRKLRGVFMKIGAGK
jgi:transcriptional regulator with XRE-family HTH domain